MVGLGQEGLREGGGNCVKHLKWGWKRKEGKGNNNFNKGGKLGQGVSALKKKGGGWGGWNPLTNNGPALSTANEEPLTQTIISSENFLPSSHLL